MIAIESNIFDLLSDEGRQSVNDYIEFLYSRENETAAAIQDSINGTNLIGPFHSVEDLMRDLDA